MKRYYKSFILPFIPNPFSFVEVRNGQISLVTWGTKNFSLSAHEVSPSIKPSGVFGLFGCGSVTINHGGRSYEAGQVVSARALRRNLETSSENTAQLTKLTQNELDKLAAEEIIQRTKAEKRTGF